jgi:hypothetical protein
MGRHASHVSAEVERVLTALGVASYAALAKALSTPASPVSEATVRSWSSRRIPAWRLQAIAEQTGCRISWLRDGEGPQYDRNPGLVVSEPVSTYDALSPRERALLDNYRALDEAAKSTLEQTGALFAQQAAAGSRRRSGQR